MDTEITKKIIVRLSDAKGFYRTTMQGGAKGITQTRVVLCGVVPEEPWEAVETARDSQHLVTPG